MTIVAAVFAGALLGGAAAAFGAWRLAQRRADLFGRLFSFAMHEINTPVTAVNMTVINLLSGVFGDVPPEQLKWIELTRDQIGRLNALVGEIRDLVHMELQMKLRSGFEEVDPGTLLTDALANLSRGFAHAGIELRLETEAGLPKIRTDAERAARSLSSLLFHARKFRVSGPVTLRTRRGGDGIFFGVEYSGQKIPADEVRRSLDLFYPAQRRSDQILAATGLGLGLVREVVRRIGGEVDLAVSDNGAAVLTLRLPVAPAA